VRHAGSVDVFLEAMESLTGPLTVRDRHPDALRSALDYLTARSASPALTFRDHLRAVGAAIEE
jgi:hypothetical protein